MAITKPQLLESDIWANSSDPGDIIKPDQPDINTGFLFGEKPPNSGHNYYWNLFTKLLVNINQNGVPEWDTLTEYNAGALTKHGTSIYQAIVNNTGTEPGTDDAIWKITSLLGFTEKGGVLWSYSMQYAKDDIVGENGNAYIALEANINRQPSQSRDVWKLILDLDYLDDRYVNVVGDTMTGELIVPTVNGGVPWTTANMGHTSGLDADMVDGYHASDLLFNTEVVPPIGSVIAFSGDIGTLNTKWKICDGANGTPDLRDKFIRGGSGTDNGTVGGSNEPTMPRHNHTANHGHTATTNEEPDHGHSANHNHPHNSTTDSGDHKHDAKIGSHTIIGGAGGISYCVKCNGSEDTGYGGNHSHIIDVPNITMTTGGAGRHDHHIDIPSSSINTGYAGTDTTEGNLPPYYKLVYIMRVA